MYNLKAKTQVTALAAVFAATAATGASAATTTIDFTGETVGAIAGETFTLSQDGLDITFSGVGLNFRTLPFQFEQEYGLDVFLSTAVDSEAITMSINGATVNSVTYLNPISGVATSEVDEIEANAFDGDGNLIDSATNSDEFTTLFGDISTITFDDTGSTGYVLGQFVIDFEGAAVPLPAGLPLLLAGLGGLAMVRRRKTS